MSIAARDPGDRDASPGDAIAARDPTHRDTNSNASPDDGTVAYTHGSFFGRRKGHKLRFHQADLIEHLLPRLSLDIGKPAPPILRACSIRRSMISGSKSDSAAANI